tara:strand:+ start:1640 stop:2533 length:894 start_codon:yes stop_codon:yes gene_type:complete
MSAFKPFTTSDVILTPFKVNKSFTFQGASALTASDAGIDRFLGKNLPYISGSDETGQISTQSQALIYSSVKQLYYTNYLRGENGSLVLTSSIQTDGIRIGQGGIQPMYDNFLPNTLLANRIFPTGSNDVIGVMSIPSNLFGEYIKPGTFRWKAGLLDVTDDGEGSLLYNNSVKVGDIIYEQGMAIISGVFSLSRVTNLVTLDNVTCSFQSTMTIYESQYKCTLNPNEFTYTQNPSAISGSSNSGIVYDFLTGSYFEPYITTVGLYNNANQLVAVGKLSQPLQSSNVSDTTILVNLDL